MCGGEKKSGSTQIRFLIRPISTQKRQQPAVASSGSSSSICNSSLNRRLGTPRSCRSSKFPRGAQHPDSTPQGARPLSPHNFEAGTSGPSSCCRFRAKDSRVPGSSARIDTAEEEAPRLKKVLTLYTIIYYTVTYCYIEKKKCAWQPSRSKCMSLRTFSS